MFGIGKLDITEYTVTAPVTKPVRCALVTDLHNDRWERVYEAIKQAGPDIILIGGDLIEDMEPGGHEKGLAFLSACAEHYPTFYGLGNHERFLDDAAFAVIRETGAKLLINDYIHYGELVIGAVRSTAEDLEDNAVFLERYCRAEGCRVLLCHRPEWYIKQHYRDYPIPVIVSGHAHGGQMRPFGIALYSPGQGIFPKYTAGVHEGRLVISRGISNQVRLPRFWNPPELVMLTIAPDGTQTS